MLVTFTELPTNLLDKISHFLSHCPNEISLTRFFNLVSLQVFNVVSTFHLWNHNLGLRKSRLCIQCQVKVPKCLFQDIYKILSTRKTSSNNRYQIDTENCCKYTAMFRTSVFSRCSFPNAINISKYVRKCSEKLNAFLTV